MNRKRKKEKEDVKALKPVGKNRKKQVNEVGREGKNCRKID